jgi:hypothetical protein
LSLSLNSKVLEPDHGGQYITHLLWNIGDNGTKRKMEKDPKKLGRRPCKTDAGNMLMDDDL